MSGCDDINQKTIMFIETLAMIAALAQPVQFMQQP